MLSHTTIIRNDLHISDCVAEVLSVKNVVQLSVVPTRAVRDEVRISLLEPGVADSKLISNSKL